MVGKCLEFKLKMDFQSNIGPPDCDISPVDNAVPQPHYPDRFIAPMDDTQKFVARRSEIGTNIY